MSNPGLDRFLAALEKLPPYQGVAFRGLAEGVDVPALGVLTAVVPASIDPRVASEGFTCSAALVLLSRTGREVGPLSPRPHDREVALLPGTGWRKLAEIDLGDVRLHVLEELDLVDPQAARPAAWGETADDVVRDAVGQWREAQAGGATAGDGATAPGPGKFCGPWPLQPHRPSA